MTTSLLEGLSKSTDKEEYEQMVINVTALAYQGKLFLHGFCYRQLTKHCTVAGTDTV